MATFNLAFIWHIERKQELCFHMAPRKKSFPVLSYESTVNSCHMKVHESTVNSCHMKVHESTVNSCHMKVHESKVNSCHMKAQENV